MGRRARAEAVWQARTMSWQPVGEEVVHRLLGEALHHPVRPGAVGNPGVVPQVEIVVVRQDLQKLPQHHQPAESGIKHADHG